MSSLLRKFKAIRCPIDGEVLRARAFEVHLKEHHPQADPHRIQRENSCLICTAHSQPQIEFMTHTRRGNDAFIDEHKTHLPNRLKPLSELEKEAIRQAFVHEEEDIMNVDLDASPMPPPPLPSPPNAHQVVGTIENVQQAQDIRLSENSPSFTDIETMLFLSEQNPTELEPGAATQLIESYQSIYEPGLQYPPPPPPQTPRTETVPPPPPSRLDAAQQTDQQAENTTAPQLDASQQTMEDIPLLTFSLNHIREINSMKNVMLTQIIQDNVDLLESKLQSRKRALQVMEQLFETHAQDNATSDDMALELSRIIHLKNKLIQQLLRETASLHPHVYNVLMSN